MHRKRRHREDISQLDRVSFLWLLLRAGVCKPRRLQPPTAATKEGAVVRRAPRVVKVGFPARRQGVQRIDAPEGPFAQPDIIFPFDWRCDFVGTDFRIEGVILLSFLRALSPWGVRGALPSPGEEERDVCRYLPTRAEADSPPRSGHGSKMERRFGRVFVCRQKMGDARGLSWVNASGRVGLARGTRGLFVRPPCSSFMTLLFDGSCQRYFHLEWTPAGSARGPE